MEGEEAEDHKEMYGLMRAKETKEVEKDLVSIERETQSGLAWHPWNCGEKNNLSPASHIFVCYYRVYSILYTSNIRLRGNI